MLRVRDWYIPVIWGEGAFATNKTDIGTPIALDNSGAIYITRGAGLCFPVTVGAFQRAWEGGGAFIPLLGTTFYADAFVSKFCLTAGCGIVCGASCDLCSPLAVSGLRLEAVQYGEEQVRLHWEAVENTPYTAFSLQRLSDARWEEQKLLEPSYSAYITEQKEPFAIYRIVGFTADGRTLPSNAVAVHFSLSRSSFMLFPNPVSAQRELIIVPSAGERLGYEVQNTLGVVVAHWSAEEEVSRTKVQLSPGIYWVREISTGQVQKLVVVE